MSLLLRRRRDPTRAPRSSTFTDGADWGPSPPPVQPGGQIALGYDVVAHLRRGRRLDVYDVWDVERGCRAVAKTLRPERAADNVAADRLRLEGSLLATIAHPHLVRAYGTTTTLDRPRPVVVLETLAGQTVDHLVATHGRLRGGDVALLGLQIGSAIGYLHRHGWLHLDIKPANVVNVYGRAVLLDLSLAARPGEHCSAGTFDYLAPEQARADVATEAADVWGLAAMLYEALAGYAPYAEHPHRGPDGRPYHPQVEREPTPLRSRSRVPRRLSALIEACLRLEPGARPSLPDLLAGLAECSGIDLREP